MKAWLGVLLAVAAAVPATAALRPGATAPDFTTRGAVAGGSNRMAEFATIQSRVAEATGCIEAARLMMKQSTQRALDAARAETLLAGTGAAPTGRDVAALEEHRAVGVQDDERPAVDALDEPAAHHLGRGRGAGAETAPAQGRAAIRQHQDRRRQCGTNPADAGRYLYREPHTRVARISTPLAH